MDIPVSSESTMSESSTGIDEHLQHSVLSDVPATQDEQAPTPTSAVLKNDQRKQIETNACVDKKQDTKASTKKSAFSISSSLLRLHSQECVNSANVKLISLNARLQSHGFFLRDDSRLAFLYGTNNLPTWWTEYEVAHELMCVQWLCTASNYISFLEGFMWHLARLLKYTYKLQWTSAWRIVQKYGPEIVKYHFVLNLGGLPAFPLAAHPPQGYYQHVQPADFVSDNSLSYNTTDEMAVTSIPNHPEETPYMPNLPTKPNIPNVPTIPNIPNIPNMPNIPCIQNIQNVPHMAP
tara:strand:- start:203 stop:1081 length:879 start_codon:yes stop_codon:yes gene_type:complete